jgi:hypothetical protein
VYEREHTGPTFGPESGGCPNAPTRLTLTSRTRQNLGKREGPDPCKAGPPTTKGGMANNREHGSSLQQQAGRACGGGKLPPFYQIKPHFP